MKIYNPLHLDKIAHISKEGEVYQLDSFWKMGILAEKIKGKYSSYIANVDEEISSSLFREFHTENFVEALVHGKNREFHIESCGVFWQPWLPQVMFNRAFATVSAMQNIIDGGKLSVLIADGGHHTIPNKAYGFGPINAVGIAINKLKNEIQNKKVVILDLDVHRGNGFSFIEGTNIHIFDIWNKSLDKWEVNDKNSNYHDFEVINVDEYTNSFDKVVSEIVSIKPDCLIYYSGVDVLDTDRMSGTSGFTIDDFRKREDKVFETLAKHKIPTLLTIGGGYVDYKNGRVEEEKENLINNHLYTIESAMMLLQ